MTRRLTYILMLLGILLMPVVHAQTIHPYGLQQMVSVADADISGTPRFIGMAGAMTAVGGDPSAVLINPAGLGVYRHSQFSLSADGTFRRYVQDGSTYDYGWFARWKVSQVSYVFALTHPERVAGVVSNNLMISYNKRADMYQNIMLNDRAGKAVSQGDWIQTNIDEYLYLHDANLHYAMNISNCVYWGAGLTLEWMQARQIYNRCEDKLEDRRGQASTYDIRTASTGRAFGVGGSVGLLVHPIRAIRLGVSVESPVIGKMRQTDIISEKLGSNSETEYTDNYRWKMTTPLKASAGLGLQWANHGLLSLQYDLHYHKLTGVAHTARAGLEVAMTNHWMIELGYAYSTLYARQRAAVGVNYMGRWIRIGMAYNFSWCNGQVIDPLYYTTQGIYRMRENRIVLSFQWNT